MQPLRVTAKLSTGLAVFHPIALDGVLAAMVAVRRGYPPISLDERIPGPNEIPLAWNPAGFHHASQAHFEVAAYETIRWTKRTQDLSRLALLTSAKKLSTTGRWKAYWMPLRKVLPAGMTLTWWVVGDALGLAEELRHVLSLGSKRNAGHGLVACWTVEPWEHDWSILRPGEHGPEPARSIPAKMAPADWRFFETRRLSYPYWRRDGQVFAAVPRRP